MLHFQPTPTGHAAFGATGRFYRITREPKRFRLDAHAGYVKREPKRFRLDAHAGYVKIGTLADLKKTAEALEAQTCAASSPA